MRFGEFVLWLAPGKRASRLASGMKQGVYLGIKDISGEHYVGTAEGVFIARTIRRVVPELQANKELFNQFQGAPWAKTADEVADPGSNLDSGPCGGKTSGGRGSAAAARTCSGSTAGREDPASGGVGKVRLHARVPGLRRGGHGRGTSQPQ